MLITITVQSEQKTKNDEESVNCCSDEGRALKSYDVAVLEESLYLEWTAFVFQERRDDNRYIFTLNMIDYPLHCRVLSNTRFLQRLIDLHSALTPTLKSILARRK